jgi:hypothetical protein
LWAVGVIVGTSSEHSPTVTQTMFKEKRDESWLGRGNIDYIALRT